MDLLPLRIAAGRGSMDGHATPALVAAGFTLLQRCAPLVRALAGRRSAILLPVSAPMLVALAASDGRGALLLASALADGGRGATAPDAASPEAAELARQLRAADVGAVFTLRGFATALPADLPRVLLDDAPRSAEFVGGDRRVTVDLGSHFGLDLEGDADADGRDEECLLAFAGPGAAAPQVFTHRELIHAARLAAQTAGYEPGAEVSLRGSSGGVGTRGVAAVPGVGASAPTARVVGASAPAAPSPSALATEVFAPLVVGAQLRVVAER